MHELRHAMPPQKMISPLSILWHWTIISALPLLDKGAITELDLGSLGPYD